MTYLPKKYYTIYIFVVVHIKIDQCEKITFCVQNYFNKEIANMNLATNYLFYLVLSELYDSYLCLLYFTLQYLPFVKFSIITIFRIYRRAIDPSLLLPIASTDTKSLERKRKVVLASLNFGLCHLDGLISDPL